MCLVENTVILVVTDLSMSVHGKDLPSWNNITLEGLLPGISSFQPRDMSFSGVNADTFSASIFTETFSLPSSKTEEIANWTSMHPISSMSLYTLHLRCFNITRQIPQLSSVQPHGMVLSCSQHFSRNLHAVSHHFLASSHSFASRPSKLQSCGSLPGAQQRPWGLESNGTRHNTSQGGSKKVATMIQNNYTIRLSHLRRLK